MKKAVLSVLALLLAAALALGHGGGGAAASSVTLAPVKITTQKGRTSGQVTALYVKDLSGTQDTAARLVRFQTPGSIYQGTRSYTFPGSIDPASVGGMQLMVNYRGPRKATQSWTWSVYDWTTSAWVKVGTNAAAQNWVWTALTFNLPSPTGRFIAPTSREIRVRLQSNQASNDAYLDYEAITIIYTDPNGTWQPGLVNSWQIQYTGQIDTSLAVDIYNLDWEATPKSVVDSLHGRGIKVMCYLSAGSWEDWRADRDSFPPEVIGSVMDGWPDERWLDIRAVDVLMPIMAARMEVCRQKGFDGIDPDNVNGYTNETGFPLTYEDQLAFNIALADAAHDLGLSIGLKNDIEQIPDLVDYFDWQLNEQCFEYNECHLLLPFIQAGKPVFNIEYNLQPVQFCGRANLLNFNSLKKNLELDAARVACR